jgi:hypothetical protein
MNTYPYPISKVPNAKELIANAVSANYEFGFLLWFSLMPTCFLLACYCRRWQGYLGSRREQWDHRDTF